MVCLSKFSCNQLSYTKATIDKIPPLSMPLNVSNIIAENINKSGITLFSRSLIPINETFDKQNQFGTSNCDQDWVVSTFNMTSMCR